MTLRSLLNSAGEVADRLAGGIEKHARTMLAVYLAGFALLAVIHASLKCFWADEIFTAYLSRLASLGAVWNALVTGTDQTPIGFYAITRWLTPLAPDLHVALRLPGLAGFLVMLVCIWIFARRRLSAPVALLAVLFPTFTAMTYFATEARPYGLVLGCTAASLVLWQSACAFERRPWSLAGLWFVLTTALQCHFYAVLILIPLLAGEAVRTLRRGRPDIPLLAAILGSTLAFLPLVPQIVSARTYSAYHWSSPGIDSVLDYYLVRPEHLTVIALLAAALVALAVGVLPSAAATQPQREGGLQAHEYAALLTLSFLPVFALALSLFTKVWAARYSLPADIGLSILGAVALDRIMQGDRRRLALFCVAAGFTGLGLPLRSAVRELKTGPHCSVDPIYRDAQSVYHLPLVHPVGNGFVEAYFYAPPAVRANLYFLLDRDQAIRYIHTDSSDRLLPLLARYEPLNTVAFEGFLQTHPRFLVAGRGGWVLAALADRHYTLRLLPGYASDVFLATPPGASASDMILTDR